VENSNFTLGAEIPFEMDFDAIVTFFPNVTQAPSSSDLFRVMQADGTADYETYITDYVWKSEPMGG
jgi:hypothetical protein